MWKTNQINPSNYRIIRRFDLIVAVAKAMKGCHFYYLCPQRHSIIGIAEEPYFIREVMLPSNIIVDTPFIFRIDTLEIDIVNNYIDFLLYDDTKWALIPLVMKDDVESIRPCFRPVSDAKLWTLVNSRTGNIVEHIDLYGPDGRKSTMLNDIMTTIRNYVNLQGLSSEVVNFMGMEANPIVQTVFTSKAAMGEKFLPLSANGRNYGIIIFKNLFSLNKSDKLDIHIRDKIYNPNLFDVTFTVTHDKNPIKYIIEGKFIEHTHCTFVHID